MARPEFEKGAAPADLPRNRMLLVLKRSAEQDAALETLLAQQQDRKSAQYHKWLTPEQFGQQFGPADEDIQTITSWLQSHGFQVNGVSKAKNIIEFSGTASQVREAFHTEIHKYLVNGQEHWANASDPEIPAALTPVVTGVATLHNFTKKSQLIQTDQQFQATYQPEARPEFTSSTGLHALSPGDYSTIYNLSGYFVPFWHSTIAVVGRSNINMSDVNDFGAYFGVFGGMYPVVINGPDPGDLGGAEEAEAVLDTTWAMAIATPVYTEVRLVVSQTTNTTDGVDLSEEYIIENNLADVMTESFSTCEAAATQAEVSFHLSLAQQAAVQGITYVVAAGDSGAEGCDYGSETSAMGPLSVNLLASTPYTIAVGGTEFNENGNSAQYWNSWNNYLGGSAVSYIPEDVWNESCTSGGVNPCPSGYSPELWAGSGGASTLFPKPSWQTGVFGIPNDGARDVPDVSLSAAGHDPYLICLRGSCMPNSMGQFFFVGAAGTSAATPAFAGIMALVVGKTGDRQGQAAGVLYQLAAAENLNACNGSNTSGLPASSCVFNDVTVGNNVVPGESGYGTNGGSYQAGVGYDLATGLGSVNVGNLLNNWPAADSGGISALSISATSIDFGDVDIGTTSSPQEITITNTGTATFFSAGLIFPALFENSYTSTCGSAIIPGRSCTISLTVTPPEVGVWNTNLSIYGYNGYFIGEVALSGTGVATLTAGLSTGALNFGNQKVVAFSAPQAITITNSTAGSLNTSAITITGANAGDFLLWNNCGRYLWSGSNCTVNVVFNPQLIGSKFASILIPVDDNGTMQTVALSGIAVATGYFEIVNALTGKVLDIANGSVSDGTPIVQNALNGGEQQQWQLMPTSDGYYEIKNVGTGKVLDLTGGSDAPGTLIQEWDYLGGANQQWQLVPVDDVHYKIVSRASGEVLDVTGGSTANGTYIQQWVYVGDGQQMWVLVPVGSYNILNDLSGKVLDVTGGSVADGMLIQQWTLNGNRQQQWQFMPVGGGYVAILNRLTGKVLDVTGASTSGGTLIQEWDYLDGANQQWQLVPIDAMHFEIVNRLSGLVLDDTNFSTASGTPIQQWGYEGGTNQQWQVVPVTYYNVVNRLSGEALDVTNGSIVDGTLIQQWALNGVQQQQWQLVLVGSGNCLQEAACAIMNNLSGKVLDVTGGSTSNGAPIQQWDYQGGANQQWQLVPVYGGYYEIVNLGSGKVLDVTGGSISNGALLQQWQYLAGWNQQWQLVPVSN